MTMRNTETLMVLCMLGAVVLLMGAEGTSVNRGRKIQRRSNGQSRVKEAKTNTVDLILDPNSMASSVPLHQVGNNSLSPWTISYTHDRNRVPPYIAKVTCLLKGCLNAGGREVMDFESKPIFHQILVLRRVEVDRRSYAYKLETETISVGCTCVRPNVMQQK
ncbi:interleukin 17a/f1 [Anguilla rostrata]|uniref:interleukin 17a/f1 n=1 Tax=Anguilla rostrata TaxID=7938 RepID=UPI0030D59065